MNVRKRFANALLATPLLLGSVAVTSAVTTAVTGTPAFADASCANNISIYGTKSDGRLTYSVVDPDNGNFLKIVTSEDTLGFTPKTLATLNFNTLLITSTAGQLYRVDISTNNESLVFYTPVALGGGWTHDLLTYDGHGHLYGIADGKLLQYVVSGTKPTSGQVGMRKEIGTGFTLKTLTAIGDDKIAGTTTTGGKLLNYQIDSAGDWTRTELKSSGWSGFDQLLSPGGGLYFGRMPDGGMYWYEDQNPNDGSGKDITYHVDDPVTSNGWTQPLLSAQPATCTYKASTSALRDRIANIAFAEVGTQESECDRYASNCYEPGWCAQFAKWVWKQAGITGLPGTNNARGLGAWGEDKGLFKPRSGANKGNPQVGDWVIYGSPVDQSGGHVQIVTRVYSDGQISIVGGNQNGGANDAVTTYRINPATAHSGRDGTESISGYVSPPGA
jgi:hypothetical protein